MIKETEYSYTNRKIFTVSGFARNNLLFPQETGWGYSKRPHKTNRIGHSSLLLFIVESGSGEFRYKDVSYNLNRCDCVFIHCNDDYSLISNYDNWKVRWIHFSFSIAENFYTEYITSGGKPAFTPINLEPYFFLIDYIYENGEAGGLKNELNISARLAMLIAYIGQDGTYFDEQKSTSKAKIIRQIAAYIDSHHMEKITLESLSDHFFINKFTLSRSFSDQLGISLSNYILRARINHAKQLLRFTNDDLEDIAQKCGFRDGAYFTRKFKQAENMTPSAYRKMW